MKRILEILIAVIKNFSEGWNLSQWEFKYSKNKEHFTNNNRRKINYTIDNFDLSNQIEKYLNFKVRTSNFKKYFNLTSFKSKNTKLKNIVEKNK